MMARLAVTSVGLMVVLSVVLLQGACAESCPRERDSRFNAIQTTAHAEQQLLGKSRDEIVEQYGQPGPARFGTDHDATYFMRPQGFCMDGWYLVINFDSLGVVVEAAVIPG